MKEKRWVQHVSGNGQKWEVGRELPNTWVTEIVGPTNYYLPKSEYRLCEPPEEWEDVTHEIEYSDTPTQLSHLSHKGKAVFHGDYRLRKIQLREEISYQGQWAFKVERRKS